MKTRAFLDTNVFIYGYEFPDSNSAKIIELINEGEIEAIISERVLKEVTEYFNKYYFIEVSRKFRKYLLDTCTIVMNHEVLKEIKELKGKIKDKDLEQLAAARKYGLKFLISYDRDFEGFDEYNTPKKFLEMLNKEAKDSDF